MFAFVAEFKGFYFSSNTSLFGDTFLRLYNCTHILLVYLKELRIRMIKKNFFLTFQVFGTNFIFGFNHVIYLLNIILKYVNTVHSVSKANRAEVLVNAIYTTNMKNHPKYLIIILHCKIYVCILYNLENTNCCIFCLLSDSIESLLAVNIN